MTTTTSCRLKCRNLKNMSLIDLLIQPQTQLIQITRWEAKVILVATTMDLVCLKHIDLLANLYPVMGNRSYFKTG